MAPDERQHTHEHPRVAIVGIGGIFPGAPDLERFWANIAGGDRRDPGGAAGAVGDRSEGGVRPPRWAVRPGLLDARRLRRGLQARPRGTRPRARSGRSARPDVPACAPRRPPGVARRRDRRNRPPPGRGRDGQPRPADRGGGGARPGLPGAKLRRTSGGTRCAAGGGDRAAESLRGGVAGGAPGAGAGAGGRGVYARCRVCLVALRGEARRR